MEPIEFFDANLIIGKPNVPRYRIQESGVGMREDLAPFRITGGLVRHTHGQEANPVDANRMLSGELEGVPGFEAVWAVMPHWTGEFPEPGGLARQMREAGCRAAVAYPLSHGFSLAPWSAGKLLEMLELMSIPLVLPVAQAPLEAVEALLSTYPSLPLILAETGYGLSRNLYPLLEGHSNLYVETSMYMIHRGIEEFARLFGAERLLFGSRYVHYAPGAAVAGLMYAEINDSSKRLIAGGNAKRLLQGVQQ